MQDPRDDLLRLEPYLPDLRAAVAGAGEGAEREGFIIDAALLAGVMLRETLAGFAPGYVPRGAANGRGDGGHGRGLFQLDDRGPYFHLVPWDGAGWPVIDQARAAIAVLEDARAELQPVRLNPQFTLAVVCRYNASFKRIMQRLEACESPDLATTPGPFLLNGPGRGDYGSDVLARRARLLAAAPEAFGAVAVAA
jgi:hypothetical protein